MIMSKPNNQKYKRQKLLSIDKIKIVFIHIKNFYIYFWI